MQLSNILAVVATIGPAAMAVQMNNVARHHTAVRGDEDHTTYSAASEGDMMTILRRHGTAVYDDGVAAATEATSVEGMMTINAVEHAATAAPSVQYITVTTTVCGTDIPTYIIPSSYPSLTEIIVVPTPEPTYEPETTIVVTSKVTATHVVTIHTGNSTSFASSTVHAIYTPPSPPPTYESPSAYPPPVYVTPSSVGTLMPTHGTNYTLPASSTTPRPSQYTGGAAEEGKAQVGCLMMAAALVGAAVNLI